jgi:hypothetical protein
MGRRMRVCRSHPMSWGEREGIHATLVSRGLAWTDDDGG